MRDSLILCNFILVVTVMLTTLMMIRISRWWTFLFAAIVILAFILSIVFKFDRLMFVAGIVAETILLIIIWIRYNHLRSLL